MKTKFKYSLIAVLMFGFFASGLIVPADFSGSLAYAQRSKEDREKRRELRREERRKRQEAKKAKKEARKKRREARKERKKRKRWCRRNPDKCKPPTVSELPVHYMVASGMAVLAVSGGFVYQLRRRDGKDTQAI